MKEFCFATNNNYKLKEVRSILASKVRVSSLQDIGCHDELDETQLTIEGNSLQKAEYIFRKFCIPCFADDTGLEVEALGGAPGVISARYAGEHRNDEDNIQLLIKNLENRTNRNARFRTVVTLMNETGVHVFEGVLKGTILTEKKGSGGFGYDPVFKPTGFTQTLAEMSAEQKNTISHRAIAMNKLFTFLINNF